MATLPFLVNLEPRVLQFTAAMVILNVALGIYSSYQARILENLPLQLNTQHFLKDAWFSILMLMVLLAVWQNQLWLDAVFAIALLLTLPRSLWRVLKAQLPLLLRPTAIAPEAIAAIANSVQGVTRCMSIRSRGMVGRQVWVELRLAIHPEFWDARETLGDHIEAMLRQTYGPLRADINFEPTRTQQKPFCRSPKSLRSTIFEGTRVDVSDRGGNRGSGIRDRYREAGIEYQGGWGADRFRDQADLMRRTRHPVPDTYPPIHPSTHLLPTPYIGPKYRVK